MGLDMYTVTIVEKSTFEVEVSAQDEDEAEVLAHNMLYEEEGDKDDFLVLCEESSTAVKQ